MKKLSSLILLLMLSGCADRSSLETYQDSGRTDKGLVSRYQETNSATEEYISRVAKRVMVVSDRPDNKYKFQVTRSDDPSIELDHDSNTITISKGALDQLNDEAELAATLTLSMERLDNAPNVDQRSIHALANAGYDPQAMLDLEEQYYYNLHSNNESWMKELFPASPTSDSIMADKMVVEKMPKGLTRGSETYKQQING